MTLAELGPYLEALAVKAGYAAIPGADSIGESFRDEIKKRLTERSHVRGTRTPSPPGSVPAKESGALADSVKSYPASTPVVATSPVGPNLGPRDWVNEYGLSNIRPVRFQYMHFFYDGERYEKRVDVPQREYMLSTAEIVARDPAVAEKAAGAFYAYLWG